ncbi:uncharacterized protein [Aegilops tauschii subsp. strangulata]|uniref:uncharacterized protein n=1 Tax=Aegilops tauschii subsp. strangulata TaxID=200361 RepID=UPI00098B5A3B|nr:uncharacterized protein LOC109778147 [Aegilops tauschii subsp. strangulata]
MEYIYEHYVESFNDSSDKEDYMDETTMMQAFLADAVHAEEHVLNFKGSIKGHRVFSRNKARGHLTLMDNYFAPDALLAENLAVTFGCEKMTLIPLYHDVRSFDVYFILKKDVIRRIGFSGYQKCTTTLQMLAYGTTADSWNEYPRMSESTCGDAMAGFATFMVEVFGPQYLREPTVANTERLLAMYEARGCAGLIRSLYYMHWRWKNCSKDLQGQYQGHVKQSTIILEAVASHDLWIWHA